MKHVGSSIEEIGSVVASKALGRGYLTVPSVGSLGVVMLFLDRVIIGWIEVVGGGGVRLGKAKEVRGSSGKQWGDGEEEGGFRDSDVVFGIGCGLVSGFGPVCSGDDVLRLVSGLWAIGKAVGRLWA